MAHWQDNTGTRHEIRITVAVARRLKDELGLDLLAPLQTLDLQPVLSQLASSPDQIVGALACIEQPPDPEAFAELFDGSALETAAEALLQAIIDFFPPRQQTLLRKLLATTDRAATALMELSLAQATTMLDSPDFTTALNESLMRGSGSNASPLQSAVTSSDSRSARCSSDMPEPSISSSGSPDPSSPAFSTASEPKSRIECGPSEISTRHTCPTEFAEPPGGK